MATIARVRCPMTGGVGGLGVTTFYCLEADLSASLTALATFLTAWGAGMPPVVNWQIPASGDTINDADGRLAGTWSSGSGASVTATGSTAYAAGTGAMVRWNTGAIIDGRRVLGRTFFVPMSSATYDSGGDMVDATRTSLQTATNTFTANSAFVIWSRPTSIVAADGQSRVVTTGDVLAKVVSLKSRRS